MAIFYDTKLVQDGSTFRLKIFQDTHEIVILNETGAFVLPKTEDRVILFKLLENMVELAFRNNIADFRLTRGEE